MRTNQPHALDISTWLKKPKAGHVVQFYPTDEDLLEPLSRYIHDGLASSEPCIVLATKEHLRALESRLKALGSDVKSARENGLYITANAGEMLNSIMKRRSPNRDLFTANIGKIVETAAAKGKPVRAYGELVALLWKEGNDRAAIKLEELWNELQINYDFSLFCAYPELHFIMDIEVKRSISQTHTHSFSSLSEA